MSDDAFDLPDDIAALRAMVLEHRAEIAVARSGLIEQRYEIEALKARLARLLRVTFGRSSEKLSARVEQRGEAHTPPPGKSGVAAASKHHHRGRVEYSPPLRSSRCGPGYPPKWFPAPTREIATADT